MSGTENEGYEAGTSPPRWCPECERWRAGPFGSYRDVKGHWHYWCAECVELHRHVDGEQDRASERPDWNVAHEYAEQVVTDPFGDLLDEDGEGVFEDAEWVLRDGSYVPIYYERVEEAGGDEAEVLTPPTRNPNTIGNGTGDPICDTFSDDWFTEPGGAVDGTLGSQRECRLASLLRPIAMKLARRYSSDPHELVQLSVVALWNSREALHVLQYPRGPEPYLRRAGYAVMIDHLRAERALYRKKDDDGKLVPAAADEMPDHLLRPTALPECVNDIAAADHDEDDADHSKLYRAMERVRNSHLIKMRAEGLSWEEIAAVEGLSVEAARQAGARARRKLRERLESKYGEGEKT